MGIFTGLGAAFTAYRLYFIGAAIVAALFAFGGMSWTKGHYKQWGQDLWSANEAKQIKIDAGRDTVQAIGKVRAAGASDDLTRARAEMAVRFKDSLQLKPDHSGYYNAVQLKKLGGR